MNERFLSQEPLLLVKKGFDKLGGRGSTLPRHSHPHQFLLKSFQIFGRKNCRETIFALENGVFRRKNRPVPTVHAAGHD